MGRGFFARFLALRPMSPPKHRSQPPDAPEQRRAGRDPRRAKVAYDSFYFDRLRGEGRELSLVEKFTMIHEQNLWHGPESRSGEGSGHDQTQRLVAELPGLFRELGVGTLLDVPCGAYGWIAPVTRAVAAYVGADVVPELIAENTHRHADAAHRFELLDLTRDPLPPADLILCRDCLVHLSIDDALAALRNVAKGSASYLLTTTFAFCTQNEDIVSGDWRPLNLERPPFDLPPALRLVEEHTPEGGGAFADKALGLWRVSDLACRLAGR